MRASLLSLLFAVANAAGPPAFEVASVKPAVLPASAPEHAKCHMTVSGDASRIEFANASLLDLVETAYRVDTYQISGPDWMAGEKFDFVGKIPPEATREQAPEMLQQLLAVRFAMKFRRAQFECQ